MPRFLAHSVALLAEGVDRNLALRLVCLRRLVVALLAEGVDRNLIPEVYLDEVIESPSSRRAWIEIESGKAGAAGRRRRPPRGGRG